ncbi:hypothetical protein GGI24_003403, partial [Coemansia furcata]
MYKGFPCGEDSLLKGEDSLLNEEFEIKAEMEDIHYIVSSKETSGEKASEEATEEASEG